MSAEPQITEAFLTDAIKTRLEAEHVEITDTSGGCGQSFSVLIVAAQFAGLNSLKRHRAVNSALKQEIARIHAWSARCQTPDEWARDREALAAKAAAAATVDVAPDASPAATAEEAAREVRELAAGTVGPPMDGTVDGKVDGVKE